MEVEFNLLTNSITLPTKTKSARTNAVKGCAAIGLGGAPAKSLQQSYISMYAVEYTHEAAYKRVGVPLVQITREYKYVWV